MRTGKSLLLGLMLSLSARAVLAEELQGPTVSAALSLKGAFEEIAALYQAKHPGERVQFNFAASGVLQRQIEGGAPVDLFASASSREMDELERKGLLAIGKRMAFARNGIVLITPSIRRSAAEDFRDLQSVKVRRIAIGNPATVPAGKYAEEVLRAFNVWEAVREKLVFAENVRQVLDYAARGEVDAGMVFFTDAMGVPGIQVVASAPQKSHTPAVYYASVVAGAKNSERGQAFIDVLLSPEGREVMKRRGFLSAP
ncbi:MAG: molybdate ABC transporter substrate-binding protein [Nitrospirae bacterium]|nr:molybdate ABC transporter substrate-binding protein [Nitrospirota bacterium]